MNNRTDKNIDRVIAKVLQNCADKQEKEIFNDWLVESPENRQIFNHLNQAWGNNPTPMKVVAEEELVDKIWKTSKIYSKSHKKRNLSFLPILLKLTACIAIVAGIFLFNEKVKTKAATQPSYEMVTNKNIGGQRSEIHLTDGTLVWLNAESSLTYKKPFDNDFREVDLVGEAYFEVAKDSTKPFIVNFNGSKVKVLGTTFNISSYRDDPTNVISLAEGKIEITHGLNSQLMTAGWITKINPQTGKLESFKGKVEDNICWVNDIILFKDASYQEVFSKLERWYGVRFVKSGKPKPGLRFNGSFKNEYLENILEHLVLKDNLTFRIDKEQVFISFN